MSAQLKRATDELRLKEDFVRQLKLLREKREARYSGGPYGQTCEHIAWNEALGGMLVDSRWQLRVHPQRPPGPPPRPQYI